MRTYKISCVTIVVTLLAVYSTAEKAGQECPASCRCDSHVKLDGQGAVQIQYRVMCHGQAINNHSASASWKHALHHLSITNAHLTQVPAYVGDFTNLRSLDMSGNHIEDMCSPVWAKLHHLEILVLDDNGISEINCIKDLAALRHLQLARNKIVSVEGFDAAGLQTLSLQDNHVNMTCNSFKGLPGIVSINLAGNHLSQIQPCTFTTLNTLSILVLSRNNLERIQNGTFSSLSKLTELWLDNNKLSELESEAFGNNPNLIKLSLENNNFLQFPTAAIRKLTNLEMLTLSGNPLRKLTVNTFKDLSNVKQLSLNNIAVDTVEPMAFEGLQHVMVISMQNLSSLHSLPVLSRTPMTSLVQLDLSESGLTTLNANTFDKMPNLEVLRLEGNPFNCDCSLKWIPQLLNMDNIPYWLLSWAQSQSGPTCATPINMHSWPITGLAEELLTCEPPVIEPVGPQRQTPVNNTVIFKAILSEGIPSGKWITPWAQTLTAEQYVEQRQGTFNVHEEVHDIYVSNSLIITNITMAMRGSYILMATNAAGESSLQYILQVKDMPDLTLNNLVAIDIHQSNNGSSPDDTVMAKATALVSSTTNKELGQFVRIVEPNRGLSTINPKQADSYNMAPIITVCVIAGVILGIVGLWVYAKSHRRIRPEYRRLIEDELGPLYSSTNSSVL